ncbi:6-carboxytetrahydropterin synthase [Streptomyces sp. H10-C2]|uniref:6-pyruvoyl trahydropterin synthase family protein n=1 Tax=unclassified Streptomyces TaxID=2593676 RepID=UPI0024BB2CBA|nr:MULTISPECIES: 6-carboxytetrahydropterin synthase [unclassified Streptomyces]MDJ0342775.1 6-carboxytetrahydropterin synthase [Streptomyces sp. PH10-H1]MDJ0372453.1 6-carboxytetrahydropterin synthase [Streptomyces sp. H10-C2]
MSGLWRIGKLFRFEATRELDGQDDGHSFTVEAVLSTDALDDVGFVVDFGRLAPLKEHIGAALDHQFLNNRVPDASDAGLAAYLAEWARANLAADIGAALTEVRTRTGRPAVPTDGFAVRFEATHQLDGLPAGHQCGRRHGHSYLVTASGADGGPAVVPKELRRYIEDFLDGTVLNKTVPFNPTSELLSAYLLEQYADGPAAIRVSETETSWAEYTRWAA